MKIVNITYVMICLMLLSCGSEKTMVDANNFETVYVGTYTKKEGHVDGKADGIFVLKMDKSTGQLKVVNTIVGVVNPSYLVVHPNQKYMYAVQEASVDNRFGRVVAYNIEGEEAVRLNDVTANGFAPCHISIDPSGKYVLVANYMETIASYGIMDEGKLSRGLSVRKHIRTLPEEFRQEAGHPHMILSALDSQMVFVTDLGVDSIFHYELADTGHLHLVTRTPTQHKAGPRHMVFHPNNQFVYVLNELNRTVEVFQVNDPRVAFENIQIVATRETDDENVTAGAIRIHPNGQFLYASNRGLNDSPVQSISIFSVNENTGEIELIDEVDTKGKIPRDFNISPDGQFLLVANQDTDNIVTYKINTETGKLDDTGHELKVSTPVCIQFL